MKKKVLSIMLIIAVVAAFFTGCGKKTPDPGVNPTPVPSGESGDPARPKYEGDVIEFNLYNEGDYLTRWSDVAKEWMLNNYKIKIKSPIPGIDGDMNSESSRKTYNTAIANLFIAEDTKPDYMPAIKASSVGIDACFKELGPDYLVDLNPYIKKGGILEAYTTWVWGSDSKLGLWEDAGEYWQKYKAALEVNGALYALPRRECMPVQNYLGYATKLLEQINVSKDDLPTTWQGFVELLNKFKAYRQGSDTIPFVMAEGKLSGLLSFVASTYGLEFNEDFAWTQKNGEPLWTYYWDEYLEILKRVRELADQNLVKTDAKAGKGVVVNYNFNYKDNAYKAYKNSSDSDASKGNSIATYTTSTKMAIWSSHGTNENITAWRISDKMIAQEGKKASLYGISQFDAQNGYAYMGGYIAIGNRLGKEFALRVMDMLSFSMSDNGLLTYFFGKEGTPFADSYKDEKAGCFAYDENRKLRLWADERFGWKESVSFWSNIDSHASQLKDFPYNPGAGINMADKYGITDTGFWPDRDNYRFGTTLQADVTAWFMKLTAYWSQEAMSKDEPNIKKQRELVNKNGTLIEEGMYKTPAEYIGGSDATKYERQISDLKAIAKNFTVDFLKGDKTSSDWTNYIKSLDEAGYKDVYEFYKVASYGFSREYNPDVESQTTVNNQRNK